jgi:hypothetical protein
MYIPDLDYLETSSENTSNNFILSVQGGIRIELESVGYAQGSETALTITTAQTAAISFGFGSIANGNLEN